MGKVERLNEAFQYLRSTGKIHTQIDLAQVMKANRVTISNALKDKGGYLNDDFLLRFCNAFEGIFNEKWLLTGKGEMLNEGADSNVQLSDSTPSEDDTLDTSIEPLRTPFPKSHYQPIYDIRVCAGLGIGFDGNENKVIKWVAIPDFRGCQGMMVFGDSMYDKYKSGDVIFFRQVFNKNYIENGQPYIIITREDRLLKLIYDEGDPEYITLVSYNTSTNPDGRRAYPDMKVCRDDILHLYKVVGRLERNQI